MAHPVLSADATDRPERRIDVGDTAPDFSLVGLDGKGEVRLSSLRGKVVLVDFWDSWCAPCRDSLPRLSAFRDGLARDDFEVVAVNLDIEADDAARFLAARPLSFPVVRDEALALVPIYGIEHLPSSFLLDRDGIIRRVHRGEVDARGVEAAVASLIEE